MHWVVLLLIFTSVSGICFILCRTLFSDLEHQGAGHSGGWDGRSQLEYFISRPKLRKIQICFPCCQGKLHGCGRIITGQFNGKCQDSVLGFHLKNIIAKRFAVLRLKFGVKGVGPVLHIGK